MRPHEILHNISQALSLVVSGVHVLTLRDDSDRPRAILLSLIQQVSFEPPRIAIALHKDRELAAVLAPGRAFVLNVLAADSAGMCEGLAALPGDPGEELAKRGARVVEAGLVLDEACGHLVCRVAERVDMCDHWLYIADVVDGAAVPGRRPLVHARASGLRY